MIQAVQDHYPWHVFHYFAPVKKLFQTPLLTKQKQLDIFKGNFGYLKTLIATLETPTLSNLNMKDPYKEMIQVLGLRFERVSLYRANYVVVSKNSKYYIEKL